MHKRLFVLAILLVAVVGLAGATGINCTTMSGFAGNATSTSGTLSSLISDTTASGGCYFGDFYFSGFTYGGSNTQAQADVSVTISVNGVHGGLSLSGSWGSASDVLSWSYTQSLCTTANCTYNAANASYITLADAQFQPSIESAIGSYGISYNATNLNGTIGPGPGNNQIIVNGISTQSVTFTDSYTASGSANYITGIANDETETIGPEPSTMMLMGGALIGLGAIARKRRKA